MATYRAAPAAALCVVPLDELTLVYHRPAGATHLLAEPAPEILTTLQAGPADLEALLARLAARFDIDPDAAVAISERLDELVAAKLVEVS